MSRDLEAPMNELADIREIMKSNIEKLASRGENLSELQASCEVLEAQAAQFQTTSKKLKRKMCLRKIRYQLAISIIVICFLLLLVVLLLVYFLVIKRH